MNSRSYLTMGIGLVFLVWGIGAIIKTILDLEMGLAPLLWFSYIGLLLLGIGCLRRSGTLIAAQIAIIGVPYLLWNIDFFYYLFANRSLFGIVDYFFIPGPLFGKLISAQHLFNLPLSFLALYCLGGITRTDFWKLSAVEIVLLFFTTRLFTSPLENVNCVYRNCANFDFGFYYPLEWFMAYTVMISLTSWILIKIFYKPFR